MDYKYWNTYYEKNIAPTEPSDFSNSVLEYLDKGKTLLELGCGNGRDSLFFAKKNIKVVAIDQAHSVIEHLKNHAIDENIEFVLDDFTNTRVLSNRKFDYIYSRFTMHSISKEDENRTVKNVYNALNDNGLFFIEARSVKDKLCGLGEKIGHNEYIHNDHYRRFIELEEFVNDLIALGFNIISATESDEYAICNGEKPMVIRIIAAR